MENTNPIKQLIRRWPSRSAFAAEVGANVEAVHKWATTGRIPSWRQHSVAVAAAARGMDDVTPDWLMAVHTTQQEAQQ